MFASNRKFHPKLFTNTSGKAQAHRATLCVVGGDDGSRCEHAVDKRLRSVLQGNTHTAKGIKRFVGNVRQGQEVRVEFEMRLDAGYVVGDLTDELTDIKRAFFPGRINEASRVRRQTRRRLGPEPLPTVDIATPGYACQSNSRQLVIYIELTRANSGDPWWPHL